MDGWLVMDGGWWRWPDAGDFQYFVEREKGPVD